MRSKTTHLMPVLILACSHVPLSSAATPSTDWTQWRGPDRDGRIDAAPWPHDLKGLTRTWRMELGPGYSGPLVSGDKVYVTETRDEKDEVVRALNRHTGEQIWQAEWAGAMDVPFFARSNGDWIRATPAMDEDALYVAGMRDVLVCLDAATGKQRWRVDFPKRFDTPIPSFGFASSPMVHGDYVYAQAGGSFVKLDKRTGATVWRSMNDGGGMMGSAFSSPTWDRIHGVEQLLVQSRTTLAGVDPSTGSVLWSQEVPAFRGMNILTPTVYNNGIFTSTHRRKSFFYQVSQTGDGWSVAETWTHKAQGYMSSPILLDDYAYLHLGNGRFTCLDLRNGEEKWRTKSFGKYWSMIANDNQILALDERGDLLLIHANPVQFDLRDSKKIADQESWGHLAVSGNAIFVRELKAISAWRWSDSLANR